jgi:5'-phosphate synthase pdxT subunit
MGTCAGLILLSKRIVNGRPDEDTLGLIDIDSDRNAYGSQFHSCRATGQITIGNSERPIEMVLIRAPQITRIGDGVKVLARIDERPMMVRQGNILALTFHPEMGEDSSVHKFFLESVAGTLLKPAKSKAA